MMPYRVSILLLISLLVNDGTVIKKKSPAQAVSLTKLEKGDWLFRQGTSLDSALILRLGHGQFSHIGVVIETEPTIRILHATTDDDSDHPNQVIVSTLNQFFRPDLAMQSAVVRPTFLTEWQRQQVIDVLKRQIGKSFVLDSQTKPHRYCTTVIEQAIQHVEPAFSPAWQTLAVPFFQGKYLFPEAFLNYPQTTQVYISTPVPRYFVNDLKSRVHSYLSKLRRRDSHDLSKHGDKGG